MKRIQWRGAALLAALVLVLPLVLPSFGVSVATEVFIMAIFAMSLGLIMGYAGLVSLGHAAFFGVGAYTVALLGERILSVYVLVGAALLLSAAVALLSGALLIRTSGAYFLMLTLAFGQVLYAVAFQMRPITGGADGMSVAATLDFGFAEVASELGLYYLMGVAFLLCYLFLRLFVASPAGKAVKGIMENESRMRALGYNVRSYKLLAYTISGVMAGFAGALYAYFNFYVSPELVGWLFSGQAMIMVIVGGVGTLLGPAIGAGVFIVLQNYLSSYTDRWPLIMGAIFVIFVLVGRGGVVHWLDLTWKSVTGSRSRRTGDKPASEESETGEKERAL